MIICRACNLDMADLDSIRAWAADLGALPMPISMQPPGWEAEAVAAAEALTPFIEQLIVDRRAADDDDFLSLIIRKAGDTISHDELVAIMAGICVGGQEGVRVDRLATSQFLAMDGKVDELRADPSSSTPPSGKRSGSTAPTGSPSGTRPQDHDLLGHPIHQGDLILAFLAAGNRDARGLPRPRRLRPGPKATTTGTGGTWPTASASTTAAARRWATP